MLTYCLLTDKEMERCDVYLNSCEWGWKIVDGILTLITTDRNVAPDNLLTSYVVNVKKHAENNAV